MRRNWLELIFAIAVPLALLIAMTGCASTDYLAEAQACGTGVECEAQWDAWNKAEDRIVARELQVAREQQCESAGGVMVTQQVGALKRTDCMSKRAFGDLLEQVNGRY